MRLPKDKKTWLGTAVSALCLLAVVQGIDSREVLNCLASASLPYLAVAMLWLLASVWLMALRWKCLLLPLEAVKVRGLVVMIIIGYCFDSILPARAGEAVRAYLLARRQNCSALMVFATLVIEKVLNALTLLLFLSLAVLLIPVPPWVTSIGFFATLMVLASVVVLVGFAHCTERVVTSLAFLLGFLGPRIDRVLQLAQSFAQGLDSLRRPRAALIAVVLSILVWISVALMFAYGLLSFHIHLSRGAVIFITAVVNLGLVLPASPANLGTYHLLTVAALAVFGIDRNVALAFAVVFHASQVLIYTLPGLALFWREMQTFDAPRWQSLREARALHKRRSTPR